MNKIVRSAKHSLRRHYASTCLNAQLLQTVDEILNEGLK